MLAALAFSLLVAVSHAQDVPKADVSVGYSPLYIIKGYTIWMNGGSASIAVNANHWFGVVGDFGGYVGHVPGTLSGETYTFGPRFSYRKLDRRVVPFAQALFGGSHFSQSTGGITGGGTQFTFALEAVRTWSARKADLLCGWKETTLASAQAVRPRLRCASASESCIELATSSAVLVSRVLRNRH